MPDKPSSSSLESVLNSRATNDFIVGMYDDFSENYEVWMRKHLQYQAPERIHELIGSVIGDASGLDILDIGCGTGLAGALMKPRAARLVGIDLSPEMLARAKARGIYDELAVAEIIDWMTRTEGQFDLIVACDCLIYFPDLGQVASLAAKRLKPGGWFALTVEKGETDPYFLTGSGRFAHHPNHIRDAAAKAGLTLGRLEEACLRKEEGAEVIGLLAIMGRPGL